MIKVKIKKLHDKAILPHYADEGANGFDIFTHEDVKWRLGRTGTFYWAEINTGLAFEFDPDYGLFLFSRSGHGFKHHISLANKVAIIDSSYRGEIKIKLECLTPNPPEIKARTAIAQGVLLKTPRVFFEVVDELSDTSRGLSGFGSTGM